MKRVSIAAHIKRKTTGWILGIIAIVVPVGFTAFYFAEFMTSSSKFVGRIEASTTSRRNQILGGDIRAAELQIRRELNIHEGDSAVFLDFDKRPWLDGENIIGIDKCESGLTCKDWSKHTLTRMHPIYFDNEKTSLWGYFFVRQVVPTDWKLALGITSVFLLLILVSHIGMQRSVIATIGEVETSISSWASAISASPKADADRPYAPFTDFDRIDTAFTELSQQISRMKVAARNQGALETLQGVGHDILNPVARMKRILGMVDTKNPESVVLDKELFDLLNSNLRRLSSYASHLKVILKNASGPISQIPSTNVGAEVSGLIAELRLDPEVIERSLRIESKIEENCFAPIGRTDLNRIIENLCSNAIQASNPDSEISINVISRAENIQVRVIDSGAGMNENTLKRIFDFGFTTKINTGTGLGLFVVKKICEENGMSINVKSTVQSGTEFELLIPRERSSYGA